MKFKTDVVIGLEVHVEMNTMTKLFCGCPRTGSLEPNTRTCPVCLGHPGSKPVLNRAAVEKALKLALAVEAKIAKELIFSRKSYFYPDMSKNYQITQYEIPLSTGGNIKLPSGKEISLVRIHIEEDPASLVHPAGMEKSSYVLVDYNRSGNPLVEIVTEPQFDSAKSARLFMKQLISILSYLGIFNADDIIKTDANVSIKESGYVRAEIKNVTGFKEIERALTYEIERQKRAVSDGSRLVPESRAWDADAGITRFMRSKETEDDYGYIVDPDLVATTISQNWIEKIRETLPELSHEKTLRLIKQYELPADDARIISAQIEIADLYEKVASKVSPKLAAKWLRRELARVMNYNGLDFADLAIDETHLIDLLSMVEQGEITEKVAQKILEKLMEKPFDVRGYVKQEGLNTLADSDELEALCRKVISDNPKAVEEFCSGEAKALNFLIGKVMQETRGTASPKDVKETLVKLVS